MGRVTVIYVVQHGDKERVPGDPGLTELGRDQAAAAARCLSGAGLRALFSSPLRRARETATAIAAVTGLPVLLDDRLRERLNWDGTQTFDAFRADWDRSTHDRDYVLGNGESSRSAGERMRVFVAGLRAEPGPVAVVSHGGATIDLLRTLAGDAAPSAGLAGRGRPGVRDHHAGRPAGGRDRVHRAPRAARAAGPSVTQVPPSASPEPRAPGSGIQWLWRPTASIR
jgi:broad specificity phosphatase PhoE